MLTLRNRQAFKSLLEAAFWQASEPDRPVLHFIHPDGQTETISRAHFQAGVHAQTALLHNLGAQPDDLVIIAQDQELTGIYRFWAALYLGVIPSFFPPLTEKLDPDVYQANMSTLVDHSGAKFVLTSDDYVPLLAQTVGCPVIGSTNPTTLTGPNAPVTPNVHCTPSSPVIPSVPTLKAQPLKRSEGSEGTIAFLQHSSGTTGLQKGVALSHAAVLNQLASYSDAIGLSATDVVVSWLPLYHDMGLIAGFLLPLFQGIPLVLMSPFAWVRRPALLLEAISQHGGTLCWLPNFAYNHCARRVRTADLDGLSLASMRLFINCSEPVRADSHELFLARFAGLGVRPEMLAVSYAMAENTFAVTQTKIGHPPSVVVVDTTALLEKSVVEPAGATNPSTRLVSCGPPIAGTGVQIVDEVGSTLPDGHVGEILVRSDCMLS
ncbi:MAG: AMP-binding protein, partial [Anaerolineales bacterium]|nr:AMP-binding protein [Anaerolineales bacterium]